MSRQVEIQFLRPDQIIKAREAKSLIFLPLGPIEWHGPHLPLGVDPLRAHHAAVETAQRIGGVVMPTLFCGTERERSPATLRNIGFNGDEYVVGMDFPANALQSQYFDEEVFAIVLKHQLELLIDGWGFRNVVIVNGHGGENHLEVIRRLAIELSSTRNARIIAAMPMADYPEGGAGHATLEETETILALYPESVDLALLPDARTPLRNTDWAIVDDAGFRGGAESPGVVCAEEDPRAAEEVRGRDVWARTIDNLVRTIEEALRDEA